MTWNADDHPRAADGKWKHSDQLREDHGQVADILNTALATNDDDMVARARAHQKDLAIEELARMDTPIELPTKDEHIAELLSHLSDEDIEAMRTPYDKRLVIDPAQLKRYVNAANSQEPLFGEQPTFEPSPQHRTVESRRGETANGIPVEFFQKTSPGVYRYNGYVMLDPSASEQIPGRVLRAASVGDGVYRDELDEYIPYAPSTPYHEQRLREWAGPHYKGPRTVSQSYRDRAIAEDDAQAVSKLVDLVADEPRKDPNLVAWTHDPELGMKSPQGYWIGPERNQKVPERYRSANDAYLGLRRHIAEVFAGGDETRRNALDSIAKRFIIKEYR